MSLSALVIHQEENAAADSADKSTGGPVKKKKKKGDNYQPDIRKFYFEISNSS